MNTWIFLRGLTRERTHWGSFPDTFRQVIPNAQILSLDLPGNGLLHGQRSPMAVQDMVAACRQELERRGVEHPVRLLAMSLGAMVAADWARAAPAEIAGCVLINTSMRPFSPFYRRLLPRNYLSLLRLALLPPSAETTESSILRMTSNHPDQHRHVVTDWVAARTQRPVSRANALRQLVAAACYQAPATAPTPAILLLSSRLDHLVDNRCSQAIARAWNCPLVAHPDAGHDLPLDDPLWVAETVRRWLNGHPNRHNFNGLSR